MISEAWYRETMPLLKAGIEDRTLLLPRDAGILSDFRSLRVVKGVARVPEQRSKDKTGGRHGDSAVACAMMLDARKELGAAEPWEYAGFLRTDLISRGGSQRKKERGHVFAVPQ